MVECCTAADGDRVQILEAPSKGQNIQRRAVEMRCGDIASSRCRAGCDQFDIGLLA